MLYSAWEIATSRISNLTDKTKKLILSFTNAATNTSTTLNISQTANRTISLPDATDTLVGRATIDNLTNKTLTSSTNIISATQLRTTGSDVIISSASPPTIGQTLIATSNTTAMWQNISTAPIWIMQEGGNITAKEGLSYMNISSNTQLVVTLPDSPSVGATITIASSEGGFKILQNKDQKIILTNIPRCIPVVIDWSSRDSNRDWYAIACSPDYTKQIACVMGGRIYTSTDSGFTWTPRESNRNWTGVAISADGTRMYACFSTTSTTGGILVSTNSGSTWTNNSISRGYVGVCCSWDGIQAASAAFADRIYVTTNTGGSWIARGNTRNWTAICCSYDLTKIAATVTGGQINISMNSGVTWTAQDVNRNWTNIACTSDGYKLIASVNNSYVFVSSDYGFNWAAFDVSTIHSWKAVSISADGSKMIACVEGGYIYTADETDLTWIPQKSAGIADWAAITCSADGTKYTAVSRSSNGGKLITSNNYTVPGEDGYIIGNNSASITITYIGGDIYMSTLATGKITPGSK